MLRWAILIVYEKIVMDLAMLGKDTLRQMAHGEAAFMTKQINGKSMPTMKGDADE
jgi:hypothetical protein